MTAEQPLPAPLHAVSLQPRVDVVLVSAPDPVHEVAHVRRPVALDERGRIAAVLAGRPGAGYLVRPDGHVACRWQKFAAPRFAAALARLMGRAS